MLELTDKTFTERIAKKTPVLVDFWAAWCMPCKIFSPVLEELSHELKGKLEFAKLNIDDYPEPAEEYEIISIPTAILFQNGKALTQMVGALPKKEVLRRLEEFL